MASAHFTEVPLAVNSGLLVTLSPQHFIPCFIQTIMSVELYMLPTLLFGVLFVTGSSW